MNFSKIGLKNDLKKIGLLTESQTFIWFQTEKLHRMFKNQRKIQTI
jgi:hypothetical protein